MSDTRQECYQQDQEQAERERWISEPTNTCPHCDGHLLMFDGKADESTTYRLSEAVEVACECCSFEYYFEQMRHLDER